MAYLEFILTAFMGASGAVATSPTTSPRVFDAKALIQPLGGVTTNLTAESALAGDEKASKLGTGKKPSKVRHGRHYRRRHQLHTDALTVKQK